ncbi:MAG TPA: GDCCVxC domain-containing (seleno)protein [Casimicrobiaceae bacterium]
MSAIDSDSVITCPQCGFAKRETMPTDACQFYYECEGCKALLRPKPGDCCVFCSFGSVNCPPMQMQRADPGQCAGCRSAG